MKITRTSILSGLTRTLDLDVTEVQLAAYEGGLDPQDAFPHLSDDDREFIQYGTIIEDWTAAFPSTA